MDNKEKFTVQDFLIQLQQIDYLEILEVLRPLIVYYVTNRAINTYTLHREYRPKNIKKVNLPPELKNEYSNIDINSMANTKFGESLRKFAEVMIQNFSREDLINFYNNINTLKTSHSTFKLQNLILRDNTAGTYDAKKNKITVDENDFSTTIYHELLHMASATYKDGIRYSGFHQASLKPGIASLGKGINEGYTELLSRRYFVEGNDVTNAYEYEVIIADRLEKIIGKEKMESLYLNANLSGLIQEMKQYSNEEDIMKFISSTDFVLSHLDDKKFKLFEKGMITNSLKEINKFLIKSYSKKLLSQYQQNSITYEQITTQLAEYVSSLTSTLRTGKRVYEILSDEDLMESFESVFGKSNVSITSNTEENSSPMKK